ncbi:hypothetical protein BDV41DRAFT_22095 [Aspergillus transmontanensis]|uniref:Uncharacterized protein n=1 Tax=Aspergillus transmontanensis TaxID=1034304 RepID=A0A5N6WCU3_9EURO|nr:hypothetical protein BDV41DRAFT_22095 [Aspergillus transmontanensis]
MHSIRVASFLRIGVPNRCNFDMMTRDGRLVWPLALLNIRTLRYFGSPAGAPLLGTRVSGNGAYMRPITRCLYRRTYENAPSLIENYNQYNRRKTSPNGRSSNNENFPGFSSLLCHTHTNPDIKIQFLNSFTNPAHARCLRFAMSMSILHQPSPICSTRYGRRTFLINVHPPIAMSHQG